MTKKLEKNPGKGLSGGKRLKKPSEDHMKKNKLFLIIPAIILAGLFIVVSLKAEIASESTLDYVAEIDEDVSMNWTKHTLRLVGNGFGPENVKELGRRKILAKRAAKLDAYRNLLESIKGVYVTSTSRVEEMMLEEDSIKSKTEGMLKGMRIIDVSYSNDGGCEITVEVNIDKEGGFLLNALNNNSVSVKDDYPKFDWVGMRNELDKTKVELANANTNLKKTKRRLASTKLALKNTKKNLTETKAQYAILNNDLKKTRGALIVAGLSLAITEEKLKNANLKEDELKDAFDTTKIELAKTKRIVDELRENLFDNKIQLAVNKKELSLTKKFLDDKKNELEKFEEEVSIYNNQAMYAKLDQPKLHHYVQSIKDIQTQTGNKLKPFFIQGTIGPGHLPANQPANYTGLLIDARGLNLKPVLAPAILNEKEEKVYGVGVIPAQLTGGAIVDYLTGNIDNACKHPKIGKQPLILKPKQIVNESDIMLSETDTKKLPAIVNLLELQKVAILL
jgi:hypothetical protein